MTMIRVQDLWQRTSEDLPDEQALWAWAQDNCPEALERAPKDADALMAAINRSQNMLAERVGEPTATVAVPAVNKIFQAARLLAQDDLYDGARAAAVLHEGDPEAIALAAVGLEPTDANRASLRGVVALGQGMEKSEIYAQTGRLAKGMLPVEHPPAAELAVPANRWAAETAQAVARAGQAHRLQPAHLGHGSRHSGGAYLAQDPETGVQLLLKPGSGRQSPAAGARQEPAGQAAREAAFWHALDAMGLGDWAPRADLVVIGGQEYAAMRWLGEGWGPAGEAPFTDILRTLHPLLQDGVLHQLAAADWILGNPDRHSRNILWHEGEPIRLIDHGSALAGEGFDPAHDPNSFCPWYLRAWVPRGVWQRAPGHRKFELLPLVAESAAKMLGEWALGLSVPRVEAALKAHGVTTEATVRRLQQIRMASTIQRIDETVNRVWSEGLL